MGVAYQVENLEKLEFGTRQGSHTQEKF